MKSRALEQLSALLTLATRATSARAAASTEHRSLSSFLFSRGRFGAGA